MGKQHKPVPIRALRHPADFLALGFGSGLAPVAPGTFGTLMAIPLYLLLQPLSLALYLLVVVVMFVMGVVICNHCTDTLGVHDHPAIVWDEFVGYLLTMLVAPEGWAWVGLGFVLFRIFDIIKPWPIRWADRRVGGGFGIMLDDVLAGLYAWIVLQGIVFIGI